MSVSKFLRFVVCDLVRLASFLFRVEFNLPVCSRKFIAAPPLPSPFPPSPPFPPVVAAAALTCPYRVTGLLSPVCPLVDPLYEEKGLVVWVADPALAAEPLGSGLLAAVVVFGCVAVLSVWALSYLFSFSPSPSPSPSPSSPSSSPSPPQFEAPTIELLLGASFLSPLSPSASLSSVSAATLPSGEVDFSPEAVKKRLEGIAPAKSAGGSRRKSKRFVPLKK